MCLHNLFPSYISGQDGLYLLEENGKNRIIRSITRNTPNFMENYHLFPLHLLKDFPWFNKGGLGLGVVPLSVKSICLEIETNAYYHTLDNI